MSLWPGGTGQRWVSPRESSSLCLSFPTEPQAGRGQRQGQGTRDGPLLPLEGHQGTPPRLLRAPRTPRCHSMGQVRCSFGVQSIGQCDQGTPMGTRDASNVPLPVCWGSCTTTSHSAGDSQGAPCMGTAGSPIAGAVAPVPSWGVLARGQGHVGDIDAEEAAAEEEGGRGSWDLAPAPGSAAAPTAAGGRGPAATAPAKYLPGWHRATAQPPARPCAAKHGKARLSAAKLGSARQSTAKPGSAQ